MRTLIQLADHLDQLGFYIEANHIDQLLTIATTSTETINITWNRIKKGLDHLSASDMQARAKLLCDYRPKLHTTYRSYLTELLHSFSFPTLGEFEAQLPLADQSDWRISLIRILNDPNPNRT